MGSLSASSVMYAPVPGSWGAVDAETRVGRGLRSGTARPSSYTSRQATGEKEKRRKLMSACRG